MSARAPKNPPKRDHKFSLRLCRRLVAQGGAKKINHISELDYRDYRARVAAVRLRESVSQMRAIVLELNARLNEGKQRPRRSLRLRLSPLRRYAVLSARRVNQPTNDAAVCVDLKRNV